MNGQIRELEIQCWEPRQYGPAWFNSTKFAELIVRECADTVLGFHNQFGDSAHNEIRQHFRVKE